MLEVSSKLLFHQAQFDDNAQHASVSCIQNSDVIKEKNIFTAFHCVRNSTTVLFHGKSRVLL